MLNFLTTIRTEAWKIAAVASLSFGLVQTVRIEGLLFIDGYKDEIAALQAVKNKSQAKTKETQTQVKEVALTHGDLNYAAKVAKTRNPVDAYMASHRVRSPGSCSRPPEADPAPRDNEPTQDAEFIAVSRNDFEIYVENSLKIQTIHEWGNELLERKLAVPAPEFGSPPESSTTSSAPVEP